MERTLPIPHAAGQSAADTQFAYLRLLEVVAVIANEAPTLDQAIDTCLRSVCDLTGWPLGHCYLVRPEVPDELVSRFFHCETPGRFEPFCVVTRALSFASGQGMPGSVLATGAPTWIPDFPGAGLPRSAAAGAVGLRSCFAIPILCGATPVGTLEFFSEQAVEPDTVLLDVMWHVGAQLGRVVERERLARSEARNRALLGAIPDGMVIVTPDGLIVDGHGPATGGLWVSIAEHVGRPLGALMPPAVAERAMTEVGLAMAGGGLRTLEFELAPQSFEARFSSCGSGQVLMMLRDVTALKRAERERFASDERLRNVVATSHDAIMIADASGLIRSWNQGAKVLFGYEADEVIGRPITMLMPEAYRDRHDAGMARVVAGEPARMVGRTVELEGLRKDGREVPIELSLASWKEGDQRLFSGIMRDITERRDLARMKEEFLSMISHELRTPIGAVAGALELVLTAMGEDLPPRVRKIVEIADANIQRLGRLVSDLLDMHQMEWGRVKMYPEPVEASELASHALASLQLEAARLDVGLRLVPFRAWVQADGDRIVQLLTNLIGNALKYSPPGGTVTVGARAEGARLTVSVSDEGRGVPEDALDHIFERFVQVRPVEARVRGGAGLGLAICRSIIERHGGRIWAENRPEGGSVFHFTLPLIDPPGRSAQAP